MRNFVRKAIATLVFASVHVSSALAVDCPPIDGFQHVIASKGVFVSDFHGTEDSPRFLGDLVCHLIAAKQAVVIGLEYPEQEQESLERFLNSGATDAAKALLEQPFWQRSMQDGRTSQAMMDMLDRMRGLIRDSGRIRVVAFDRTIRLAPGETPSASLRDQLMANVLNEKVGERSTGEFKVLFAGNAHVRKTKGLPFPNLPADVRDRENLGYLLRDWDLLHLNVRISGGTMWTCQERGCGNQTMPMHGPDVDTVSIKLSSADPAYDGYYDVGHTTASPPAHPSRRQ